MTQQIRRKTPLSLVAIKTHKTLFWLVSGATIALFIATLFLMNHLSMAGYILSRESEKSMQLSYKNEQLEAQIAKIQTQEFVHKSTDKTEMIVERRRNFVVVPITYTAKR